MRRRTRDVDRFGSIGLPWWLRPPAHRMAQMQASTMQARAYRACRTLHEGGNLLITVSLPLQQYTGAIGGRQRPNPLLQTFIEHSGQQQPLWIMRAIGDFEAALAIRIIIEASL